MLLAEHSTGNAGAELVKEQPWTLGRTAGVDSPEAKRLAVLGRTMVLPLRRD